jgi:hypothetical protein
MDDFGYQNLTEVEIAPQAEEDGSSEEYEEDEKKEYTCEKFKLSEVKQNMDFVISFVDSHPQYIRYYLMLRDVRQDVVTEQ